MKTIPRTRSDEVLASAHRRAYEELRSKSDLAKFLSERLGRPTVAKLTGTQDANAVSRWAMGRIEPEEKRADRMRAAAYVFEALVGFGLSEPSARQWFRGANPLLNDEMPMDVIGRGEFARVIDAVRNHASR